jgi:autotransporter-associated beta strand protein
MSNIRAFSKWGFFGLLLLCFGLAKTDAQTLWASGTAGNWNTPSSWNPAIVPDVGANVFITNSGTFTVTYNSPMTAASIGSLTFGGGGTPTLTITASGFNVTGTTTLSGSTAGIINVDAGGVMNNGTLNMSSQSGIVNVNGVMTNTTTQVANNNSNDGAAALKVNSGAVANLGTVTVGRNNRGTGAGLIVSGGSVIANSIAIGTRNSYSAMVVNSSGTVTNAGNLQIGTGGATAGREVRYHQTSGAVSCGGTLDMAVASSYTAWFSVLGSGSTFSANGVRIFPNSVASAISRLTNSGSIYLGASGFNVLNSGTYTVSLNDQGVLGANADWSGNVNMVAPSGTATFKCADAAGTPHDIALSGIISGGGGLTKSGGGALTLNNANTYTGSTAVAAGSLVLGHSTALPDGTALTIGSSGTAATVDLAGFNLHVSGLATAGTAANQIITNSSAANTSTLIFSNEAVTSTFGGIIAAGGKSVALTVLGGNLTLSGQNNYAGNIFVSSGKLALSGAGSAFTGPLIVLSNSTASLDLTGMNTMTLGTGQSLSGYGTVIGSITAANCAVTPGTNGGGGTLTISGNLALNGGVTYQCDLLLDPSASGNDLLIVGGALNLSGVNTIKINPLAGSLFQGTYHLIKCASVGAGDTNNLQLIGSPGGGLQAALSMTTTGLDLVVSQTSGAERLWVGDGSANTWDLTSSNWLNAGFADTFTNGNFVTYDDSSTNQIVTLTGALQPAAVTVDATANYVFQGAGKITGTVSFMKTNSGALTILAANDYNGVTTIGQGIVQVGNGITSGALGSGALVDNGILTMQQPNSSSLSNTISGSGGLAQIGPATLTLNGNNTFTGGVIISSGTLQIGSGGTLGNGNVTNNAALIFNDSASNVVNGGISGTGSLTVLGGGTVALYGNNTYSGNTIVSSGTLLVGNAIGTGPVTVASGGRLGGNGAIRGAVTINSGGVLMPGNPVGALTVTSNLTMNSGSIMNFDLGASSDRVVVGNDLSLTGTLNVTNSGGLGSGTYTLFTYGGNFLASSITFGSVPSGKLYAIDTTTPGQVNLIVGTIATNVPAFPGAYGFGGAATGGRGGTIYHVTTLADSGTGSFRDAVSKSGRIVIFDVGGYIGLKSAVSVHGNTTIAGQTAPGGGIGFEGGEISFAGQSNIICRHVRIRPGSDTASTGDDCLSLYQATNCILDHVSFEFGPWNNIDAVGCAAITVQNSIDANPTYQQFGAHTESVGQNFAWFYNIFANSHNRNPLAKINTVFINNLEYNNSAGYTTHTSTPFKHDIVNNYFIDGPASGGNFPWYQIDNNQSMYFSGNLHDADKNGALNGSATVPLPGYQGGGTILTAPWSTWTTNVPIYNLNSTYRIAMSQAGAWPRDEMDSLLLSQIKTLGSGTTGTGAGTAGPGGGLYTTQSSTGLGNNGYGTITGGAPSVDSDGDGLPNFWENAVGLDSNNPNDSTNLTLSGYSQLEIYLNWLAGPHVVANTNVVTVDLAQYASGFTSVNPVYTVSGALNGTVSLLSDGHTAQFTTPTNYVGQSSFVFTVAGNDGSRMTNMVGLVISSVPPPQDLVWHGDGVANTWDPGMNADWLNGAAPSVFNTGDTVTFDDFGLNNPAINLSGTLKPSSVTVAANQNYTFSSSGVLAGVMPLIKSGSGNLTINTANTYGGGTVVLGGSVTIGSGGDIGSGDITLDGGTLTSSYPPTAAYNLAGSVNVPSTGTLNLSPRMTLNGISGDGALNLFVPGGNFNYENLNGAAYGGFTGTLNITGTTPGALVTLNFNGGSFDGNLANAVLNLDNVTLEGRHNSGGNTLTIGALNGTATSSLGGSGYAGNETINVGGLNLDTTFAGSILNGVAITTVNKNGTGTLTLSGANNFTGGLNANSGAVLVNGSTTAGTVTVAGSATLGGNGNIGGPVTLQSGASLKPTGTLTTSGNLTLTSAKLYFDLANVTTAGGGNDLVSVFGGTLTLSGTSTVFPNYVNGALANGTYTLISGANSTTGSAANLAWSGPGNARQTVAFNTSTPGAVLLNVSGSLPAALTWQGTNGNNWDLSTINWLNGGAEDKFFNVDSVLFDDTSTDGNVTVATAVQPGSIVVSNNTLPYVFSGSPINGSSSLVKNGNDTLTISSSNNFSGGTIINNGTVVFANDIANASGLGTGTITLNGGTLTMYDNNTTFNGATWNLFVPANATGTFNSDSRCDLYGSLTGGGTLNFNVTYVRTSLYGDWSAFSGKINVTGGGEFRVLNFAGYPGSSINLSNNVTADFQGTLDPNGTTLAIGELSGVNSSQLLGGTATNGELLTWSIGGKNTDATFAGKIGEQNTNANTSIQKIGSGTWTLTGSNAYNGGTLVSSGTLLVNNASGSGTGSGDVEVTGGAILGGNGLIAGSVAIDAGGSFAPGNPAGTLNIGTDLSLNTAATLQFTLGTTNSSANVAGNLFLAGNLNISANLGFGVGTYTLFTYSGALNFSGLSIALAPAGYNYSISTNTPGQVQLIIMRPQFNQVTVAGGQILMNGSGGAADGLYYILSSTNPALPLNLWTPIATNQFDSNSNFSFTNQIKLNVPRQFYLLRSP